MGELTLCRDGGSIWAVFERLSVPMIGERDEDRAACAPSLGACRFVYAAIFPIGPCPSRIFSRRGKSC